jgi:hypothetical protein
VTQGEFGRQRVSGFGPEEGFRRAAKELLKCSTILEVP